MRGGAVDNDNVSTNQKVTENTRKELAKMINEKHSMDKDGVAMDNVAYWLYISI